MADILQSTYGIVSTANNKADQLSTIAKGILCIPSILKNLPGILGGLATQILGTLAKFTLDTINVATSMLSGIVDGILYSITGQIAGSLSRLLQVQGQILASLNAILGFLLGLKGRVEDIKKFVLESENCKFAAAELLKCVVAVMASDLSEKIKEKNLKRESFLKDDYLRIDAIDNFNMTVEKFVAKTSNKLDKANTQLQAISIL